MTTFQMMRKTSEMPDLLQVQAHHWHPIMQTNILKMQEIIHHEINVLRGWNDFKFKENTKLYFKNLKVCTPH